MDWKIPLFKIYWDEEDVRMVTDTIRRGMSWAIGPHIEKFEAMLADYVGTKYAVVFNSGTSALHAALLAHGIGEGDEVISSPMSCTATSHPILQVGATPVFADIQYDTGNLDPWDIEHRITERTRAIMVVHWGGYPPDLNEINTIARRHDIPVIEDAAQAFGATYKGKAIGNHSRFTCFSLQAIKVLTGVEGGLMTFQDMADYGLAYLKRWYCIDKRSRWPNEDGYYDHDILEVGYKYNYNDVFASVAMGNLEGFDERLEARRNKARRYRDLLADVPGVRLFANTADRQGSNYLFTMHVERRAEFIRAMRSRGVETGVVHYRNDLYTVFGGRRRDLPNLDRYEKTYVSLPIHDHLTMEDVEYVAGCVKEGW